MERRHIRHVSDAGHTVRARSGRPTSQHRSVIPVDPHFTLAAYSFPSGNPLLLSPAVSVTPASSMGVAPAAGPPHLHNSHCGSRFGTLKDLTLMFEAVQRRLDVAVRITAGVKVGTSQCETLKTDRCESHTSCPGHVRCFHEGVSCDLRVTWLPVRRLAHGPRVPGLHAASVCSRCVLDRVK